MNMNIKFIVMVSDSFERINNVKLLQNEIPDLFIYDTDNDDVFQKFINCFNVEDSYDGLVILEDDVLLCKDFYNKINSIIHENKTNVISFFEKPNSTKPLFTKYNKGYEFLYNQCNFYPIEYCSLVNNSDTILEFKSNYFQKNKVWSAPTDTYISFVLDKHNIKYLMKLPFLVQHLPFKSTLGNRSSKRQTKHFIDDIWQEQ